MKTYLFTLILLVFSGSSTFATEMKPSSCHPDQDSCDYYRCREEERPCGRRGYIQSFGNRYCKKFINHDMDHFSAKGQKWLTDVRYCLQEKLHQSPVNLSCKRLKKRALAAHYSCYLNTGYCLLPEHDKRHVLKIVGKRVLDPMIMILGLRVTVKCLSSRKHRP